MTPDAQHPQRCTASATFIRQSDCGDRSLLPSKQVCGDCHYLTHSSTPAPAGYVITESMLEELQGDANLFEISDFPKTAASLESMIGNIRSRPTPATAGCPRWRDGECKATWGLVEEEAASKAREQVLEELRKISFEIGWVEDTPPHKKHTKRVVKFEDIESLRQHKGGTS